MLLSEIPPIGRSHRSRRNPKTHRSNSPLDVSSVDLRKHTHDLQNLSVLMICPMRAMVHDECPTSDPFVQATLKPNSKEIRSGQKICGDMTFRTSGDTTFRFTKTHAIVHLYPKFRVNCAPGIVRKALKAVVSLCQNSKNHRPNSSRDCVQQIDFVVANL